MTAQPERQSTTLRRGKESTTHQTRVPLALTRMVSTEEFSIYLDRAVPAHSFVLSPAQPTIGCGYGCQRDLERERI